MFEIRYVSQADKAFWYTLDGHLDAAEFERKVRDKRGYVFGAGSGPVGLMRYNLMFDNTPFLTLICIEEASRGKGLGRQALLFWEEEMRGLGYKMVLTSTQVDEQAQHFYRKLGYVDRGGIFFDGTPFAQPQEMILLKVL